MAQKRGSAGTWTQRFLRRRALACVAKLAGPLGESMAWGGAVAGGGRGGRGRRSRGGVANRERRRHGPHRSTLPAFISIPVRRCLLASRQAVEFVKSKTQKKENFEFMLSLSASIYSDKKMVLGSANATKIIYTFSNSIEISKIYNNFSLLHCRSCSCITQVFL
jgi:hypothetical protein